MKKVMIILLLVFVFCGCDHVQSRFSQYHVLHIYKTGDCVDRASKIRESLRKDGYESEMVVGTIDGEGHCWVRYKDKKTGKWIDIWNMSGE